MLEYVFVLAAGLIFGSFVTCASYRLPRGLDVVKKPSYCPSCNAKLGFKDLWPVLSWASTGGTCRHCKAPVHWRYPATELVTATVFFLIYDRLGISAQGVILALLAAALLIMIVVDFEHYIIPDEIHYCLLPLGVIYHLVMETPVGEPLYGFLITFLLGLLLHYGYRWLRKKDGLGFGDVKFFAVAGLWLGITAIPPFLFYSGLIGTALGLFWRMIGHGPRFPFGPALAVSMFVCVAYPGATAFFWNLFRL